MLDIFVVFISRIERKISAHKTSDAYPSTEFKRLKASDKNVKDGKNGKSLIDSMRLPAKSTDVKLGNTHSSGRFVEVNSLEERFNEVIEIMLLRPCRLFNWLQCRLILFACSISLHFGLGRSLSERRPEHIKATSDMTCCKMRYRNWYQYCPERSFVTLISQTNIIIILEKKLKKNEFKYLKKEIDQSADRIWIIIMLCQYGEPRLGGGRRRRVTSAVHEPFIVGRCSS